jgi:hypothetical protein
LAGALAVFAALAAGRAFLDCFTTFLASSNYEAGPLTTGTFPPPVPKGPL